MKKFNTKAICIPDRHYMVDTSSRVKEIVEELIEQDEYFVINRARQYGKSTILNQLKTTLKEKYYVISLSFAGCPGMFTSEKNFVREFMQMFRENMQMSGMSEILISNFVIAEDERDSLSELSRKITKLCRESDRELILMIDEVDEATNNEMIVHFLAMLRDKYIRRAADEQKTFKNVILAGVYDVKNLKLKLRSDGEHRYNSPWNIAADFDIDMAFSSGEIKRMLEEYRKEHQCDIDIEWFGEQIYDYTSGYPYLVSRICWLLDNRVWKEFGEKAAVWTKLGFQRAIKMIVTEKNTLYDDLNKRLAENQSLRELMYDIVVNREKIAFDYNNELINLGYMFGWLREKDGRTVISNRIYETVICNKLVQEKLQMNIYKADISVADSFKTNNELQMDKIIERFAAHYKELYSEETKGFLEKEARMMFLCFLKPIINGVGNYYMESETFDKSRTDIVVDYHSKRYIIELKIWHGESYEQKGKEQLAGYLERYDMTKGWLISFCFHKKKAELVGTRIEEINGKDIVETIV